MSKPPPCDQLVFQKGQSIMACDTSGCRAAKFEEWIVSIRKTLPKGCKIDWHYSGGVANVLCLGDRDKVLDAVEAMFPACPAIVMRWVGGGEPGPFRKGVTPTPDGALCASYDPDTGNNDFMVAAEEG